MVSEPFDTKKLKSRQDYDTPWKKMLEAYFEEFIRFFFPEMAEDIDWSRGYEFLDKELKKIARDAVLGPRFADKLTRLHRLSGEEKWLLNHVEIQGQGQARNVFEKRMYVYNYRIFDYYDKKVVSLAILADNDPNWRPDHFSYELWGSKAGLWFPTVKILDFKDRWDWLESSSNPFASAVMAHIKAMETGNDPENRYRWKLSLIKRLYKMGYNRKDVILLFEFIDWVMSLPENLEKSFWGEINEMEEEMKMEYISSVQRIGRQEGRQEGVANLLERQIARRFKIERPTVLPIFAGLTTEQIEELGEFFIDAESLEDIRKRADEMRKAS